MRRPDCPTCSGEGDCPRCQGLGFRGIEAHCPTCEGTGGCPTCCPPRQPAAERTLAECQAPPLKTALVALARWRTS